jgi:hypothetical protein
VADAGPRQRPRRAIRAAPGRTDGATRLRASRPLYLLAAEESNVAKGFRMPTGLFTSRMAFEPLARHPRSTRSGQSALRGSSGIYLSGMVLNNDRTKAIYPFACHHYAEASLILKVSVAGLNGRLSN